MNKGFKSDGKLLLTEQRNPLSEDIDVASSMEIVELISHEDRRVAEAVFEARASIASAIDWGAEAFRRGGRLIYVGAGTSGRLGVLDASECPPTFGVLPQQVEAVIAGGKRALTSAVEKVEDSPEEGASDLSNKNPNSNDVVIGISSGSTTPYVRGALTEARGRSAKTILITCTPLQERGDFADLIISILTGPEVLTGSTRMKAGTATKMVLNTISTGAMIRTGRTYGNLMVDVTCSNRKLFARGVRMVQRLTQYSEKSARSLLAAAGKNVKVAIAMGLLKIPREEAESRLKTNDGFLRRLFNRPHKPNPSIKAVFFDMDGTITQYALPTGFSSWAALGWGFKIYDEMEAWVESYLKGNISEEEIWSSCARRLSGQRLDSIQEQIFPCAGHPPYSRGFRDSVRILRGGYKLGIVSSGISAVAEQIRDSLHLDFELSNHLGLEDGQFDGTYRLNVPFDRKLEVVQKKAKDLHLKLNEICFVGDSPNDIEVLREVGLPVAYNPKTPKVSEAAGGNVIGDFLQLPQLIERSEIQ